MRRSVLPLLVTLSHALVILLPLVAMETQEEARGCRGASPPQTSEHDCAWRCIIFTLQWPGGFCAVSFFRGVGGGRSSISGFG